MWFIFLFHSSMVFHNLREDSLINGPFTEVTTTLQMVSHIEWDSWFCLISHAGDVNFVDAANATSQRLAYINSANNAVVKACFCVPFDENLFIMSPGGQHYQCSLQLQARFSAYIWTCIKYTWLTSLQVRLESYDAYSIGSVFLFDILHLPYGCSVCVRFVA
jgi:hypothetical protein